MQLLLTVLLVLLVVLVVYAIHRTRACVDRERLIPEEAGRIAGARLDESFRLDCILRQTWDYFDAHPGTLELTEIHSAVNSNACQILEQLDDHGEKMTVLLFSLKKGFSVPDRLKAEDEDGLLEIVLKGTDAREKAAGIIKEILEISDESRTPYQLAGSDGPCLFFDRVFLLER